MTCDIGGIDKLLGPPGHRHFYMRGRIEPLCFFVPGLPIWFIAVAG